MTKILIVDDSLMMRSVIKNYIKEFNFEIIEACNGDEALEKYKSQRPQLVFMDIIMPGTDGIVASKNIKSFDVMAKIVVCSSVDEKQINEELAKIGITDRITKPFKKEEIVPLLKKYLSI